MGSGNQRGAPGAEQFPTLEIILLTPDCPAAVKRTVCVDVVKSVTGNTPAHTRPIYYNFQQLLGNNVTYSSRTFGPFLNFSRSSMFISVKFHICS